MIAALLAFSLGSPAAAAQPALLLYSDDSAHRFLGCLSCGALERDSIWNQLGPHGSSLASDSIWNSLGVYGSALSSYSPCNSLSSSGPKVVDAAGGYYGRLTMNKMARDRISGSSFEQLLVSVCGR